MQSQPKPPAITDLLKKIRVSYPTGTSLYVIGPMFDVMKNDVGCYGEKRVELRNDTPYWRTRLLKHPPLDYLHVYGAGNCCSDRLDWRIIEVMSVERLMFRGPHKLGPYSNGHNFGFGGSVIRINLGKILACNPIFSPQTGN